MRVGDRPKLRDLRDIYLLVGECRELKHAPELWRKHLLERLGRLLGSKVALGGEGAWTAERLLQVDPPVEIGWDCPQERHAFLEYRQAEAIKHDPIWRALSRFDRPLLTRSRDQLVDDATWYASSHFNDYRVRSRVDDTLHSLYRLPDGRLDVICLMRGLGERRFSTRDRRLLLLLHREVGPLIGRSLRRRSESVTAALSPRLKDVLEQLLAGASEKEAAERIGISCATVHQYVGALYRHFGVHSRAQLLALFVARQGVN